MTSPDVGRVLAVVVPASAPTNQPFISECVLFSIGFCENGVCAGRAVLDCFAGSYAFNITQTHL